MISRNTFITCALFFAGLIAAPLASADPPEWAGKGKGKGHDKSEWHAKGKGKGHGDERRAYRFADEHRVFVHDYYDQDFRAGRCPPGLAKKNNGCMPPGQAKKWNVGQPLPRDVVIYDVPQPLVARIGPPPPGYRYARVGGDILLIDSTSALVIDVIHNLGRR
jgi:Ni/Co efflux regulator RcnB